MSRTRSLALLAVAFVGSLLGGALIQLLRPPPAYAQGSVRDLVRARRVEIVDETGRVRAWLGTTAEAAGLGILDEEGEGRVVLSYQSSGRSNIGLAGEKGAARVRISHDAATAETGLAIYNSAGANSVELSDGPHGPRVLLYNRPEHARVALGAAPGAEAGLQVLDETGKERVELTDSPQVGTRLTFADQAGRNRLTLNAAPECTMVAIADQHEQPRVGLSHVAGQEPSVWLGDAEGRLTPLAP
jgi:hypothetical protein